MKTAGGYLPETVLLAIVAALAVAGFWNIFAGENASPDPYHFLHAATNFLWLCLLLYQLRQVGTRAYGSHRKAGQLVLAMGPLLVATTALLSVHSARKGVESGQGDFLIVQNVMVTLELGLIILLAFVFRKRRKLHGAFLLSTAVLFMGIALFFTLTGFVPGFKVEGPETFYRFKTAGITGQAICLAVGLFFLVRDPKNSWPLLLAGAFFVFNELLRSVLTRQELIAPLTEGVASMSQPLTFIGTFVLLSALLATTGLRNTRRGDDPRAARA